MTIYSEIGGHDAVEAAVANFYARVLADPTLQPYFDGIDMNRLQRHQRAFVAMALGGPQTYTGRDMTRAHAGLNITDEAFDTVVGHLASTLTSLGVPDSTIGDIAALLLPLKGQIVTDPGPAG
jgi:hemoglobin